MAKTLDEKFAERFAYIKRGGKQSIPHTPDQLRTLAEGLENHARTLHKIAADMQEIGVETLTVTPQGLVTIILEKLPKIIRDNFVNKWNARRDLENLLKARTKGRKNR